jgi:hypothetical protein
MPAVLLTGSMVNKIKVSERGAPCAGFPITRIQADEEQGDTAAAIPGGQFASGAGTIYQRFFRFSSW